MQEQKSPSECADSPKRVPKCEMLLTQCAVDIPVLPVNWIWPGFLAAGKVHILGGQPGVGKSTLAMSLAASVTTGRGWPDGHESEPGKVLIWSGEDDPGDTLIPRLLLSGADLKKIHFVRGVYMPGGDTRFFDPAADTPMLLQKLKEIGDVILLVVDPIVSAITGDSHKNAEVRRGLQPLADTAAACDCALLGITHFSKGTQGFEPVERITGSIAFAAVARIVLVAAKKQGEGDDENKTRIFCRAKSNIEQDDGGFEYTIEQVPLPENPDIINSVVKWGERLVGNAQYLLAKAEGKNKHGNDTGALAEAEDFLREVLKDGPQPAKEVNEAVKDAGISRITLRRACKSLKVKPKRSGFGKGSKVLWSLPEPDD